MGGGCPTNYFVEVELCCDNKNLASYPKKGKPMKQIHIKFADDMAETVRIDIENNLHKNNKTNYFNCKVYRIAMELKSTIYVEFLQSI